MIAVLYTAGFASSVVLGTFTGSLADIVGRKKIALAYCVIYVICCLTKLSPNFSVLLIGRIMGGESKSNTIAYIFKGCSILFEDTWGFGKTNSFQLQFMLHNDLFDNRCGYINAFQCF